MAKCSTDNLPRAPYKCYRVTEPGDSGLCCSACPSGWHTADCDTRTFPTIEGAEYLTSPTAEKDLLIRLEKALILSGLLADEIRFLNNVSRKYYSSWGTDLESLLAHLSIDLSYIKAALKRVLGK
jgi:hypothetical protein